MARNDDCSRFRWFLLHFFWNLFKNLADYEGEAVKGPITRRIFRSVNSGVGIDMKPCTLAHVHQSAVLQHGVCIFVHARANQMTSHPPLPKSMSAVNINNVFLNLHCHCEKIFDKKYPICSAFHHFLFSCSPQLRSLSTRTKV